MHPPVVNENMISHAAQHVTNTKVFSDAETASAATYHDVLQGAEADFVLASSKAKVRTGQPNTMVPLASIGLRRIAVPCLTSLTVQTWPFPHACGL